MDTSLSSSAEPSKNDRIIGALAHVSVLVPFTGVIAPIVIFVTQKDKSDSLAFQSLQALAYQLAMILLFAVGFGCYMCSSLGFLAPMLMAGGGAEPTAEAMPPALEVLFGLSIFAPVALVIVLMIVFFALQAYGVFGAISVLRGKHFRYPLIGKRVESFLELS
jgi:uncharacterized Tic20 family protein